MKHLTQKRKPSVGFTDLPALTTDKWQDSSKVKGFNLKSLLFITLFSAGLVFNAKAQFRLEATNNTNCDYLITAFDFTSTPITTFTSVGGGAPYSKSDFCFTSAVDHITIQDVGTTCTNRTFGAAGVFTLASFAAGCVPPPPVGCATTISCSGAGTTGFGFGAYFLITLNIN